MATNYVKASFQEIYDVSTKPGSATIIGVHTPVTNRVHGFLHGYFEQYRKFKYLGCSIVAVPMATLPVDPLQVSYEAGESGIDPRDMLNPILHRCIHGESLGNSLERIFNLDLDKQFFDSLDKVDWDPAQYPEMANDVEMLYYSGLVSSQWKKAHVQRGFRRGGIKPMYYGLGTNKQMMPFTRDVTGYINVQNAEEAGTLTMGNPNEVTDVGSTTGEVVSSGNKTIHDSLRYQVEKDNNGNYVSPQFFAGGMHRLGWLDTLQNGTTSVTVGDQTTVSTQSRWTLLPKLNMYMMMLPPSYKCRMSLRIIIKHYYAFKEFRSMRTPLAFESYQIGVYKNLLGEAITGAKSGQDTLTLLGADAELVSDGVI